MAAAACLLAGCGESSQNPGGSPSPSISTPAVERLSPRFVDVTEAAGVHMRVLSGARPDKPSLLEGTGSGVCLLDYDRDSRLDIYVVNAMTWEHLLADDNDQPDRLFRNLGDGRFEDVTAAVGLGHTGWGQGCTVADWNDDGWPDLFLANFGPNVLYKNDGGRFADVTAAAGIDGDAWSTSAAFADVDGDGRLDLYVANYLYLDPHDVPYDGQPLPGGKKRICNRAGASVLCGPMTLPEQHDVLYQNQGDGRFRDATEELGFRVSTPLYGLGVAFTDFDLDGQIDLYVANDSVRNFLFRNDGGRFREVAQLSGAAYGNLGQSQASMGVDVGDFNGDGRIDVVTTNFSEDYDTLYTNDGEWSFTDVTFATGLGESSMTQLAWGVEMLDFDHDGRLDILIVGGHIYPQVDAEDGPVSYRQVPRLYRNVGDGRVVDEAAARGLGEPRAARGLAVGDLDNDGDLDLVISGVDEDLSILRNDGGDAKSWLQVSLRGTATNRDGIGAIVTLEAGGHRQVAVRGSGGSYLSSGDPRLHFGLGDAALVERLTVRWPSGRTNELTDVEARQAIEVVEPPE